MNKLTTLFLILLTFTSSPIFAQDAKAKFNASYKDYQQLQSQENHDKKQLYKVALETYELSLEAYGQDHINSATMGYHLGKAMEAAGINADTNNSNNKATNLEIIELYKNAIEVYERELGNDASALIDIYMDSGHLTYETNGPKKSRSFYRRAHEISGKHTDQSPTLKADIGLEIGMKLIRNRDTRLLGLEYLENAKSEYESLDGDYADRIAKANISVAQGELKLGNIEEGKDTLLASLNYFKESGQDTHPVALQSRALLVQAYEFLGESAKATEHCQAIGKAGAWKEEAEQTPLFLVQPSYPRKAYLAGKQASVRVKFTVNEQGFTENIQQISNTGDEMFFEQAAKAIQLWRFAPKFVEGKPVKAETTYTLDFLMNR